MDTCPVSIGLIFLSLFGFLLYWEMKIILYYHYFSFCWFGHFSDTI